MKILNISQNYYVQGGSDTCMFALEALLKEKGHTPIPFCAKNTKNVTSEWSKYFPASSDFDSGKKNQFWKYFYNLEAKRNIRKLIADEQPALAHLHIYYGKITTSILSELKNAEIPIIQSLHEYKLVCPIYTMARNGHPCKDCIKHGEHSVLLNKCKDNSFFKSMVRYTESKISHHLGDKTLIDRFISVSEFHRKIMIEGGIPEEKISTLHNFIDTDALVPIIKADNDPDYCVYFGRIEKIKGLETLIEAAKISGVRLKIVGTGPDLSYFKSHSQSNVNIEFLGFKSGNELHEIIQKSRFTVVPSEWFENCPMTVLESKSFGIPVIGSNIGGIPELINHGLDGFLFEPKDVESLAQHMSQLIKRSFSNKMGIEARKDALKRFSKNAHYDKLISIYKEVC